jgi:hypothetical protein
MSDQRCDVCHEFLMNCHDFRIYHTACNLNVYKREESTLLRYIFIILQAARSARMRINRIESTRRAVVNTLRETPPVITPLVDIIAEYL